MKKYFCILSFCLAVAACDLTVIDGDLPSDIGGANSIKVLKSNIIFSPDAGEGYVLVKTEGRISAKSTKEWCNVVCYGDSVAISTTDNHANLESRYAQVIIYHQGDSVALSVQQAGPITKAFDTSAVVFDHEAGDGTIVFDSNMIPEITSNVNWASADAEKNKITVHVRRNSSETFRSGTLTCKLGPESYTVTVMQLEPSEILSKRNWKVTGTLAEGGSMSFTGVLSKAGANYTMTLTGNNINWAYTTGLEKNIMTIPLGSSIGRHNADDRIYYVVPAVGDGTENGSASDMTVSGIDGFKMDYDKNTDKWSGEFDLAAYGDLYGNPVFRFEYWLNSAHTGTSSGGLRFKELKIEQL